MSETSPSTYDVTVKARYERHYRVSANNPTEAYELALEMDASRDPSDLEFIDYEAADSYDIVPIKTSDTDLTVPSL